MTGWAHDARSRGPRLRPTTTIATWAVGLGLGGACGSSDLDAWPGVLVPVDCPHGTPSVVAFTDRAAVVACRLPRGGQTWHVCVLEGAQATCHALRDKPLGVPWP